MLNREQIQAEIATLEASGETSYLNVSKLSTLYLYLQLRPGKETETITKKPKETYTPKATENQPVLSMFWKAKKDGINDSRKLRKDLNRIKSEIAEAWSTVDTEEELQVIQEFINDLLRYK